MSNLASLSNNITAVLTTIRTEFVAIIPELLVSLVILLLFYILGRILDKLITRKATAHTQKALIMGYIGRTAKIVCLILGVLVACGTVGISIMPIVTSLGVGAFAVTFALQNVLSNMLAGTLLILNQTLKVGDAVTVNGNSGVVQNIDLRYTTLSNDDATLLIPNSILLTAITKIANAN